MRTASVSPTDRPSPCAARRGADRDARGVPVAPRLPDLHGYTLSQFRKLEQDLRTRGEVKWKHAMHLVRLLLSGIAVLRDGTVQVRVTEHRDALLAIRR